MKKIFFVAAIALLATGCCKNCNKGGQCTDSTAVECCDTVKACCQHHCCEAAADSAACCAEKAACCADSAACEHHCCQHAE